MIINSLQSTTNNTNLKNNDNGIQLILYKSQLSSMIGQAF